MIVSGLLMSPGSVPVPTGPGLLRPVTRPLPFRSTDPVPAPPRFRPPFNRKDSRKDARARLTVIREKTGQLDSQTYTIGKAKKNTG